MRIIVEVKTGSREETVEILDEGSYLVRVKEMPRKGKANVAVIKLLKKHFRGEVRLISGAASRIKIFEIED